jgi:hypothetical protein
MWMFALGLLLASGPSIDHVDTSRARVRSLDGRIRAVLEEGLARSASFRTIVDGIGRSDLVVYLRAERRLSTSLSGQLTFMSRAGGARYLLISMNLRHGDSADARIAALGHELWHALEVAGTPAIVDHATLAQAYRSIGFELAARRDAFESEGAIDAGRRIRRELGSAGAAE